MSKYFLMRHCLFRFAFFVQHSVILRNIYACSYDEIFAGLDK